MSSEAQLRNFAFVVTAEHASRALPFFCESRLSDYLESVETDRIYDPGTEAIGRALASLLNCSFFAGEVTRLAVDLNRSVGNGEQFSPPIFDADEALKVALLSRYYLPFRTAVAKEINSLLRQGKAVIHLSMHSFTKVFYGKRRDVDYGLLYDPQRTNESKLCADWLPRLQKVFSDGLVEANQPYHGTEDGHTTALRKRYPDNSYIGIELEFSQDLPLDSEPGAFAQKVYATLVESLIAQNG